MSSNVTNSAKVFLGYFTKEIKQSVANIYKELYLFQVDDYRR